MLENIAIPQRYPQVRYREMAQHIAELQNSAGPPAHKMTPKGFFQHFSSDSTEAHIQHAINMCSTYGIKLYAYSRNTVEPEGHNLHGNGERKSPRGQFEFPRRYWKNWRRNPRRKAILLRDDFILGVAEAFRATPTFRKYEDDIRRGFYR
jgi:hypothetical protein